MFHKRVFNKSDHLMMISKRDKQTKLFVKKVRLYTQNWMSMLTFLGTEVSI